MAYLVTVNIDLAKYTGESVDQGSASFQLSGLMQDVTANRVYPPIRQSVTLTNGVGSIQLPATKNDPDISPTGLTYTVRLYAGENVDRSFQIEIDKNLGNNQHLADMAPATNVVTTTYASVASVSSHIAATTAVHGIANTADLATLTDLAGVTPQWGNVSGTLSNQTDLAAALAAKLDSTTYAAFTPNVNRLPVLTVAASTASAKERALADYVCDGTADDVQINAAITALGAAGGTIMLSAGTFTLAATVTLPTGVTIRGQGRAATRLTPANGANLRGLLESVNYDTLSAGNKWFVADGVPYGIAIEHLQIDGNKTNQTGGDGGIRLWAKNYRVTDVSIHDCYGVGFYSDGPNVAGQNSWADTPLASIGPLWVWGCHGVDAVYHNGPHDAIYTFLDIGFNDGNGMHVGARGPCDILFIHSYANGQSSLVCDAQVMVAHSYPETSTAGPALLLNTGAKGSHFGSVNTFSWGSWPMPGHIVCHADACALENVHLQVGTGANAVLIDADNVALRGVLDSCTPTTSHIQLGTSSKPANHCLIDVTVKAGQARVLAIDPGGVGNIVRVAANLSGTATNWSGTKGATDLVQYTSGVSGGYSRNSGTATVLNGNTAIIVTHGLVRAPNAGEILVTPTTSLGTAASYWVDTRSTSTFTIHLNASAGADVVFAWRAELSESSASGTSATTKVSASFTGTDNTLLTAYTNDVGGAWSVDTGTAPKLSSNKLVPSTNTLAHCHTDAGIANGTASATIVAASGTTSILVIRSQDQVNHIGVGINSSLAFTFYKDVAGVSTDLYGAGTLTYTTGTSHTLKLIYSGSTINAYVDGALVKTAAVTDFQTVTNVGVRFNAGTTGSIDDLLVTDATS